MPFQPIHFSQLQTVGLPWVRDFHENLQKGMQTYNMPQQVRQEFESKQLANALAKEQALQAQAQTPYAAKNAQYNSELLANKAQFSPQLLAEKLRQVQQTNELQLPLANAKIQHDLENAELARIRAKTLPEKIAADNEYRRVNLEYLKAQLKNTSEGPKSALGKEIQDYKNLVNQEGEGSPNAIAMKAAIDAKAKSAQNKGSTQTEKLLSAMDERRKTIKDPKASQEDKFKAKMELATLEAEELKKKIPESMWPRLQAGSIMQVLMDDISIKDATRYSGIIAKTQKKYDQAAGNKNWLEFQKAEGKMKALATQLRAFGQGSVQPKEMQRLIDFLDGNDWSLSPVQADKLMRSAFSTLTKEHNEYVKNAENLGRLLQPVKNKYEEDQGIPEIDTSRPGWGIVRK